MINYFMITMKTLQRIIKQNREITQEEWDEYAQKNNLFSSLTLKIKTNSRDFEQLKRKAKWY